MEESEVEMRYAGLGQHRHKGDPIVVKDVEFWIDVTYRYVEKYDKLRSYNLALVGVIVFAIAFAFFAPVPVMVGDVCLSCWGN